MTRAITLRLDEEDHRELTRQAERLKVAPGTLARMLVDAGLSEATLGQRDAKTAISRLVGRSRLHREADAVALVNYARAALAPDR